MSPVLAIDAGTTGVRAMVVRDDGSVASRAYREFPQSFPGPDGSSTTPRTGGASALESSEQALAAAGLEAAGVAAIGITNQRETTVLWDRETLRPVHPAIVWQDRRTAGTCDELRDEGWEERVRDRTGLVHRPVLLGNEAGVAAGSRRGRAGGRGRRTARVRDRRLLPARAADRRPRPRHRPHQRVAHDAVRHPRLAWDEELCERLRIPAAILPEVRPSCGRFAVTDPDAFLGAAIPVSGIAGDQQSSLFGQGCVDAGETKNTYGTGSFVLMHTGDGRRCVPTPGC